MDIEKLKTDLELVTGQRPIGAEATMLQVMARLDAIAASPETPDRLKHYLGRRSYVKALQYLEDPGAPHRL
ncbi:MAG: hypothetical protein EA353_06165 [Puniceicoccaceae bacterium]|nr:MAG: hypothetical protein EA353_06165 [Puniceicoccaceae bacterium]